MTLLGRTAFGADTNLPPQLAPPLPEIKPTFVEEHGLLLPIVGIIAAVLVLGVIVWMIIRPRPAPVIPAAVIANNALRPLSNEPETGALLSQVSHILQQYLRKAFSLPGAELTTRELVANVRSNERIGPELAEELSGFLQECDVRKFAPARPNAPANAVARAHELIQRAEARRRATEAKPS